MDYGQPGEEGAQSPIRAQIIPSFRPGPIQASFSPIRAAPVQYGVSRDKGPVPPHAPEPHNPPKSYKKAEVVPVIMPKPKRVVKNVTFNEVPDARIGADSTSGNGRQIGGRDVDKGAFWNSHQPAGAIDLGDSKLLILNF